MKGGGEGKSTPTKKDYMQLKANGFAGLCSLE